MCGAGWTAAQVKSRLFAQFGNEILAAPPKHGFDLLAWVIPGAALLAGVGLVAAALAMRWRAPARAAGRRRAESRPGLAARIDADMAGFE